MRKHLVIINTVLVLILSVSLIGMSGLGGSPNQTQVSSVFKAKVLDNTNNEVELGNVTIEGKTSFGGYLGKGKIQIPFEKISSIEISKGNTCIDFEDGGKICNIKANDFSRLYGNTSFGSYQISLKDIKKIEFIKARK
ncbi:MAG TPA: hypothetical protein VIS94_00645 [Desulfomonilia bacterium]|jgi:hypothetical protein